MPDQDQQIDLPAEGISILSAASLGQDSLLKTDQFGPSEQSRGDFRSDIIYFYIFSISKAWTTNLVVAAFRRSDFSFLSFNLLIPDLKEFLTTKSYYRLLYKSSEEKEGIRIEPSYFE